MPSPACLSIMQTLLRFFPLAYGVNNGGILEDTDRANYGLVAAIATVGMYSRVDSKVAENSSRVIELKADLEAIKRDVVKHGEVL